MDRKLEHVRNSSITVCTSARSTRTPWGWFVFFSDPDGNGWAVQQPLGPS